jgi:hypothetical protein
MGGRAMVKPMKVDVGAQVNDVAVSPTGSILLTTTEGRLICIDRTGRRIWGRLWYTESLQWLVLRVGTEGRAWIGLNDLLIEIDPDCRDRRTISLVPDEGERLGSFLLAPGGFYVCLYRPGFAENLTPRILKLDQTGSPIWSKKLPVVNISMWRTADPESHDGMKPRDFWRPEVWCPTRSFSSEPLLLSGNRLVTSFYDDNQSGLGCLYGMDSEVGTLLWITESVPTGSLAIAGPGRFYQGIQGYGAFETRLLGPDGSTLQRWESHGDLILDEDGLVRSVEMENCLPSRMRFVTLHDDGTVGDGPLLEGYYTSYPAISREGVVAFWRNGELVLIDDKMVREVIYSDPIAAPQAVIGRMLLLPDGSLVFSVGHEVWIVDAGLGSLAESPWPCGGGNLRNNPAWA